MLYSQFIKQAFNADKQLGKLQSELNAYDAYRDTYGEGATPQEMFRDLKMQSRSADVISRLEGIRSAMAEDMEGSERQEMAARLAKILASSKYYNTDREAMSNQRAERRNRLAAFWISPYMRRTTIQQA